MVATSVPSGESRVRLGMPRSATESVTDQPASIVTWRKCGSSPRSVRRQVASEPVASTRSQATSVKARGPLGSSRATTATRP